MNTINLNELTVTNLKLFAANNDIGLSGLKRKADIIAAIEANPIMKTKNLDNEISTDSKTPQRDPYARQEPGSGIKHDKHAPK